MDTDLLRTFIEVSKTRHFGRAAESLYLTQSAVSFRIRQLEQQLGVSLFTRHRNNIQLTPAGERLLPYADNILQTLHRAKLDIGQNQDSERQLIIGAPLFCWELGLQEWLDSWLQEHQQTRLRLEIGNREQLCRQLLERKLDIAILAEPSKIDELSIRSFIDYPLCLVSRQAGINITAAERQPLVLLEHHGPLLSHQFPSQLQGRVPDLITPSLRQAEHYLKLHGGLGYLPQPAIASAIKQGQLHLVEGAPHLARTLYLAYRTQSLQDDFLQPLLTSHWRIGQKISRPAQPR